MNKKLSKPSAEVVSKFGDPEAFGERELKVLTDIQKLAYGTKFYSQEYVSALLAELEAKDKRIAELERSLTDAWRERDDWVEHSSKMERRAIETERKLATPVRLPTTSGRLGVAYARVIPEVIESIRAAGFKCVGEE